MMRARGDRIISLATMAKQERALARVAHAAIREYLAAVAKAIHTHTAVRAAAPAAPDPGDPINLNAIDQSALWPAILRRTIMAHLGDMLDEVGPPADYKLAPAASMSLNAWRAAWLQAREQVLVGVPQQITRQIRDAIAASATQHGPDPSKAAAIVKDLINPDAPTWRSRAQTIARTEVVAANNQAGLAAWTAVHQSLGQTGAQVMKTWLATEDEKTRPDHADIDGTEIPIGQTFTVGGSVMTGPGDENADPSEVVNCRCTLTYRVADAEDALAADGHAEHRAVPLPTIVAAAGDPPTGVAIMLGLDPASTSTCAASGVEVPPPGLHCTVGYLSEPAASYSPEQQQALVDALGKIDPAGTAAAFASAHFNPDDPEREPCAVLLVQSDWLAQLHDQVEQAITAAGLEQATTFPIWIPHVAIAYNADPTVIPDGAVGSQVGFDRLVVGWGGQQIVAAGNDISTADAVTAATEAPVTAPSITDTPAVPDDAPADVAPAGQYPDGTQWAGPLCPVDDVAADGRMLSGDGAIVRPLPLPLSFQLESSHGGEEAGKTVIAGRMLGATVADGFVMGYGDFLDPGDNWQSADAIQSAAQRIKSGLGMVSVDTAPIVVSYAAPDANGQLVEVDPTLYDGDMDSIVTVFSEWELMGATLVADPAFGTARVAWVEGAPLPGDVAAVGLAPMGDVGPSADPGSFRADGATPEGPTLTDDSITFPDGTVVKVGDQVNVVGALGADEPETGLVESINPDDGTVTVAVEDENNPGKTNSITVDASTLEVVPNDDPTDDSGDEKPTDDGGDAITAAAGARPYPAEWFEPVTLDGPTALTVTDDGRVYGHLATFGTCHTAFTDSCVTAPSSATGYSYFHLGDVDTTAGPLAVGKLTVGGGHASPKMGWQGTVEHYDNAGAAVAVVRAHEDEFGIQVTGAIVDTASPEQIAALKRSPLSGDWRRIGGNLELVAALSVNVPGFPVPRAAMAASGAQVSLVAAGVVHAEQGDGDPQREGGLTLPSGVKLTSVDVAILASAFDEVAVRRERRREQGSALRTQLREGARAAVLSKLRP